MSDMINICVYLVLWKYHFLQMDCCGVVSYKDWFSTSFGKGEDVPDSCCLIVVEGCGKDIAHVAVPDDEVITEVRII